MPALPYELLALVLTNLRTDFEALDACSVTCRALLLPARQYIFASVYLAYGIDHPQIERYQSLAALFRASPQVAVLIRELRIVNAIITTPPGAVSGAAGTSGSMSAGVDSRPDTAPSSASVTPTATNPNPSPSSSFSRPQPRPLKPKPVEDSTTRWLTCLGSTLPIILSSATSLESLHFAGRNQSWTELPRSIQNILHITFGLSTLKELGLSWIQNVPELTFHQCSGVLALSFRLVTVEGHGPGGGQNQRGVNTAASRQLQQIFNAGTAGGASGGGGNGSRMGATGVAPHLSPVAPKRKYPGTLSLRVHPTSPHFFLALAANLDLRYLRKCNVVDPVPLNVTHDFLVSTSWRTLQSISLDMSTVPQDAYDRLSLQLTVRSIRSIQSPTGRHIFEQLSINIYGNFHKSRSDLDQEWLTLDTILSSFPSPLTFTMHYCSPHPIPPHGQTSDGEFLKSRVAKLLPHLAAKSRVYFVFRGW
ncbi:hypothetical protein BDN72DRAFT_903651 [Pluteus cervinus]|uniref:Uncharacterized protein n=1 Tax=Pluteus cervinus TaxID=181527 RepID=A0ACD3A7U7_9AGAR|nr:hypothetical protein BDN72DRAFT_903651 [Pluteus cervinus]